MRRKSDEKYLRKLENYVNETHSLLSNAQKQEREKMVCRAFLRCAGIAFEEKELLAPENDPPDIIFRSAKFEIRELLDKGRKRGDEYKEEAKRISSAISIEGVQRDPASPKAIDIGELVQLVNLELKEKWEKYRMGCSELDALVYVNLRGRFLGSNETKYDLEKLEAQGWRSVSIVTLPYSINLLATTAAPEFIRKRVGKVCNEWPHPEGWFKS